MLAAKKKRVSKKTKLSWRKHVNIKDVESFLDEKRDDERLGTSIDILTNDQLFKIDTKPQKHNNVGIKEKRQILYETKPRCFQILESTSKITDPIAKRNRVRTKEERKDRIAKSIEDSNKLRGIVKAKERNAIQDRANHKTKKAAQKYVKGDVKEDLWEVEDFSPLAALNNEWLESDTKRHNYQGLGKLKKHTPKSLVQKSSVIPNIEAPHPGTSYNPSFEDHQALLQEIAKIETDIIKQEQHLERVTTKMFKKVSPEKKDNSWIVEMSEGLNEPKPHEADSDGEFKSINPPVVNKKKSKQQRRKQKEQRALSEARVRAKVEKKKIADIYKLRIFEKEITVFKKKTELLKEKREKLKKLKLLQPKRIGAQKFEASDLDFNMGEDIAGNLRNLKSEGNLLRDRFKSLQKRNILEPSAKQPGKKRSKVKKFEKPSHKMGWESKKGQKTRKNK